MDYSNSFLSLLVPLCIIIMVIFTKRVALSLFSGIVLGCILIHIDDGLWAIISSSYHSVSSTIYEYDQKDGFALNLWNLQVFGFLFILGVISQFMLGFGGIKSFVSWARLRIKDKKGAEFVAFIAGLVIFIDDYFNALTVGQISKNLIDDTKSTRERLAYIIDSTSAPVCILMPISSWGAYILGLLRDTEKNLGEPLDVLLGAMVYNFYAFLTLLCVAFVIFWQVNLASMKEARPRKLEKDDQNSKMGNIYMLILPILSLFFSILALIFFTGYEASKSTALFDMLKNADTAKSLFLGGLISLLITFFISKSYEDLQKSKALFIKGIKLMLPAVLILLLAWALGPIIRDDIKTGVYIANLAKTFLGDSSIDIIPIIIFLASALIGFSTGTSWGTFAIMLPIVASISDSLALESNFILMCIASVLAGAVYGDHSSPISDTTILSATGADCDVRAHFITQLPYASMVAALSCLGLFITSYFNSLILGYSFCAILLLSFLYANKS